MQQTDKYKLNLTETSDTFSPEALNENMGKEVALAGGLEAENAARQTAGAAEAQARTEADADLDQRITCWRPSRSWRAVLPAMLTLPWALPPRRFIASRGCYTASAIQGSGGNTRQNRISG